MDMTLRPLALAAAITAAPLAAQAATVVYQASGDVFLDRVDADNAFADFFDDGSDDIDVAVTGSLEDGSYSGDLFVTDFGQATLLSGSVVSVETAAGAPGFQTLTAVFGSLSGTDAGRFGDLATAIFTFAAGDDEDGTLDPVDVVILSDLDDIAPVPVPASLPLLLVGMGAITAMRRKRT